MWQDVWLSKSHETAYSRWFMKSTRLSNVAFVEQVSSGKPMLKIILLYWLLFLLLFLEAMWINNEHKTICDICGKDFRGKASLLRHVKVVHEKVKNHKCNICGKMFGYQSHMKQHIAEVHEKHKAFKCSICGASFFRKTHVKDHSTVLIIVSVVVPGINVNK